MERELMEKVDVIRQRLGVTYRDASEALQETKGDLLEALILLEDRYKPVVEKIDDVKDEAVDKLKGFIKKGAATKVRIKKDDKTLFEFPASWGVLGLAGTMMRTELAFLGLVGTATALAKNWTVDLVKAEENVEVEGKNVTVEGF